VSPDYQVIYKSPNTDESSSKKTTHSFKNDKQEEKSVRVEPRGSSTGFSRRKKIPSLSSVTGVISEATSIVPATYFPPSNIYFDPKLDTLQAPGDDTGQVYQNINSKRNVKKF